MNSGQRRQLDDWGWVKLEGFISPEEVSRLNHRIEELLAEEGDRAGAEFRQEPGSRRLANLVDKGEIFHGFIARPEILDFVTHVLGAEYKLSSMNFRSANPRNGVCQPLHADAGAIADDKGYWVCNTVWMLDDITLDNGAIRVVPGSHRWGKLPQQVLPDPVAPHPDEVLITGKAGDVVVMNAHGWHGGTANKTDTERRAMHIFYCRRDKPQQQYQKQYVRPQVQQGLDRQLRWLLALDDPLNDQISSAASRASGFLK
jgi:hypothetical protein